MTTTPDWQFATGTPIPERGRKVRIVARIGVWLVFIDLLAVIAAPLARMYLNLPAMTAFTIFFTGILSGLLLATAALIFAIVTAIMGVPPAWKRGLIVTLMGLSMPVIKASGNIISKP